MHPRTADQFYRGRADHSLTAEVVAAVEVPVVASGDIVDVSAALEIAGTTGAAAIMVARGGAGNPWLVGELLAGESLDPPTLEDVVDDLRRLLARAADDLGGARAARWSRKLLGWYLKPAGISATDIEVLRRLPDAAALDAALAALKG